MSEEIKAKIEEKFSWNKAPSHYSNNESSCWSNGAIDGAEYGYGPAQEEIDRLNHWGSELLKLWGPVDEYVRALDEVKVGDSVSSKALEILKRVESQAKEIGELREALTGAKYVIEKCGYPETAKQIDKLLNKKP